ncbi:potassium channel family protein [Mesorhizobium sp. KR9-304]|uniref:potassium channel family protein n=1 Tax=Mesorhizobium sp. KR9-304 TaxID=3156614 RepID=UPI0032B52B0D
MIANLVVGTIIIAITVVIHTFGLMAVTRGMGLLTDRLRLQGRRSHIVAMLAAVIGVFAVLTIEVWLWASCYYAMGGVVVGDFETTLYFSTATFATVGYGDIVASGEWRLLTALEGLSGFLLIGWSTAYLVAAGIRVGPFRAGEHF